MNKKDFFKLIIKEKVINKKIYDASLKVEDFPEARLILTKIDDNYNFNQLINTNNIVLVNSFAAALKAELYKFIEENLLRSKIEQFIIEIVDIKIPGNAKSNTYKISKNKTNSKSIKNVRSRSTQRKSKATTKNKENIKKGDVLTSKLKGDKNTEGIDQNKNKTNLKRSYYKGRKAKRQSELPKRKVRSRKSAGIKNRKSIKKKSLLRKDIEKVFDYLKWFIICLPFAIVLSIPGINIIFYFSALLIGFLWDRYSNDYDYDD